MANLTILGGGLAGLYAAFKLANDGQQVTLLDTAEHLGGLMRSQSYVLANGDQVYFDLGTHYLLLTGEPEVDANLLSIIDENEWEWFDDSLPEGHFYNGHLDETSGTLNLINHPKNKDYLSDLILSPGDGHLTATLAESFAQDFGFQVRDEVLEPIVKKFTGQRSADLASNSLNVFGNYRLKLVPGEPSIQMKKSESFDRRLAYADKRMGTSNTRKGYPKNGGGVGSWISALTNALVEYGVEIATQSVEYQFSWSENKVTGVSWIKNGTSHETEIDFIASSLPSAVTARTLGLKIPVGPFLTRNLRLHHYTFQGEYKNKVLHWITNFDPTMESFRVTLYENIAANASGLRRITVELISDDIETPPGEADKIWSELIEMGAVSMDCSFDNHFSENIKNAFPIFLPDWNTVQISQARSLEEQVHNYIPLGQADGMVMGQIDLLKNISKKLREYR
jgi:hypothetical protein